MTIIQTRPTKASAMMDVARVIAKLSTCRKLSVGCILTDNRYEQIAIGYNGTYAGGPNDCLMPGMDVCGCIHAEVNALVKAKFGPTRAFVTTSPCLRCATLLINAGVKEVHVGSKHPNQGGVELLQRAGLNVFTLE